jgi:hypothetical protein
VNLTVSTGHFMVEVKGRLSNCTVCKGGAIWQSVLSSGESSQYVHCDSTSVINMTEVGPDNILLHKC